MHKLMYTLLLTGCLILSSCSEEGNNPNIDGIGLPDDLNGTLIYEWAGEGIFGFDIRDAEKYVYWEHSNDLNGWDVSRDGKVLLTSKFIAGRTDVTLYTLSHSQDGSIIEQFEYYPLQGERNNEGILSPDNSLIAIKPTRYQGIVIVNTEGEILHHLEAVNGEKIAQSADVVWLPGNALVFTHGNHILRTDPPYDNIIQIKEMEHENWGNLNASLDGSRLSLKIGNHIYLMNTDGTDLVQVTESSRREREAVFSPDGKYLLVGADYWPGTFSKGKWTLKIIPADGKKYNVDPDETNSPGVIPVIPRNETNIEQCSEIMLWR